MRSDRRQSLQKIALLVRNSTFGFEAQTNFSVTPTTTIQVIG